MDLADPVRPIVVVGSINTDYVLRVDRARTTARRLPAPSPACDGGGKSAIQPSPPA
jgi:hypothetical protein